MIFPEAIPWNGGPDDGACVDGYSDREARETAYAAEEQREREWHELEALARDFVKTYGGAAMIRCVSEALKDRA
jgi:hypothetical protein